MPFNIVTFTVIHTLLSLVGIVAGLVVAGGLVAGRRLDGWTGLFLAATVLTNASGFALLASAPKQTEPPFVITQLLVLAMFVWLGRAALEGFTMEAARASWTPGVIDKAPVG
jgi:hypothetical protein